MKKPSIDTLIRRMKILVDSREQLPYRFKESIVRGLKFGDYSIEYEGKSYEHEIVIERKSRVSELFQATGSQRERWERELEKLATVDIKAVLCEFDYMDIVNSQPPGKLESSCVFGSICSWQARFNVPFLFLHNRNNCRAYLYKLFFEYCKYQIVPYLKDEEEL